MPTTGLPSLEQPLPFLARDGLIEQPLFDSRVVQVVIDDLVAECRARHRPLLERVDRLA